MQGGEGVTQHEGGAAILVKTKASNKMQFVIAIAARKSTPNSRMGGPGFSAKQPGVETTLNA